MKYKPDGYTTKWEFAEKGSIYFRPKVKKEGQKEEKGNPRHDELRESRA